MDIKIQRIVKSLQKTQELRDDQDIRLIHSHFSQQLWFHELPNGDIEDLCLRGRYQRHGIGSVIYRRGDPIRSWFVLMTGNVIIGTLLFSAPTCFGQKNATSTRVDDCLVLDPSEIVVVDYDGNGSDDNDDFDESPRVPSRGGPHLRPLVLNKSHSFSGEDSRTLPRHVQEADLHLDRSLYENLVGGTLFEGEELSRESDSLSLFSARGSDTLTSSVGDHGVDLTGLLESTVDSDNEGGEQETNFKKIVTDAVVEAVQKETKTEKDISLILDLVQHMPAFNNMTSNVRMALCSVMKFVQREEPNEVLISSGVELDTWVVILNGSIEVEESDDVKILQAGDWFGVRPTEEKQVSNQVIRTRSEKCQFLLVTQEDYCRILNEGAENIRKVYEDGEVVLVLEKRKVGNKELPIVIRGEPNHLLKELFHQNQDSTYIQDFLLTYRTFFKHPAQVAYKILEYLENPKHREKVVMIFLDWMNWHHRDFEDNVEMRTFLEHLEKRLEDLEMINQLDLLTSTCARLSKPRQVVLNRKSRDEALQFELEGGLGRTSAIFVGHVEEGSKAQDAGLGKGDQILEVNMKPFKNVTLPEANAFLNSATHLSITVKYNMHDYKQLRRSRSSRKTCNVQHVNPHDHGNTRQGMRTLEPGLPLGLEDPRKPQVLVKIRDKIMRVLPKNYLGQLPSTSDLFEGVRMQTLGMGRRFGASHPDLSSLHLQYGATEGRSDFVAANDLNVLKVYREDQSFKYIIVDKEITAQQVVMLALKEFGLVQTSTEFALYEVTFHSEGCIRQKRLPGNMNNLAERSSFRSRYYIKHVEGPNSLLPDECLEDLGKECQLSFLSLSCAEVAAQLTYKDFELFGRVSQAEYVEELYGLRGARDRGGAEPMSNLKNFSKLANVEMFWVVTHICNEQNMSNRVKAIKHFIQIAKHCIECKNFNSAFAIVSGLGHQSVTRLRQTWERVPSKSQKLFEDLQSLMDPSRNMSRYRGIVAAERPPLIPFFPLVMKDLTFVHLGNDSTVDGLVNFEKLRMIAKEVRHVSSMAPCPDTINYSSLNSSAMAMMRRKVENFSMMNRKKLFEEAQMVRRVRAYLSSYKLVENENQLAEMSSCCEPPDGGTRRFDHQLSAPRPIISTSCGPKFGTNSPENIKKLVALSAGSRPFGGSAEELKPPATEDHRMQRLQRKPNSFSNQALTNLLSNSQFSVGVEPASLPGTVRSQNKPRNLSKETDSGRYSGDDGSIGSTNSNRGSPLSAGRPAWRGPLSPRHGEQTSVGNLPPTSRSYFEDFSARLDRGPSMPRHPLADPQARRPPIKKSSSGYSVNGRREYV